MAHLLDGNTRTGTIAAAGYGDAFKIQYRPALWPERDAYYEALRDAVKPEAKTRIKLAFFMRYVHSWTLVDKNGAPIPKTEANVRALEPQQFDAVMQCLLGYGEKEEAEEKNSD